MARPADPQARQALLVAAAFGISLQEDDRARGRGANRGAGGDRDVDAGMGPPPTHAAVTG